MSRDRIWELASKKLAGESSPEELLELEQLLRLNPDLHYPLQHINDIWQLPSRLPKDAEDAFHRHTERMKAVGINWEQETAPVNLPQVDVHVRKNYLRRGWMVACIAGIAVLLTGVFIYNNNTIDKKTQVITRHPYVAHATPDDAHTEVITNNGSRTRVFLPDGTQVWLNSGSQLLYNKDFGQGVREAQLTGEAYFDVTRNPEQPFTLHTKDIDIKVLGTAFNVRSYPDEQSTETSLIHGRVEVAIHNRPNEKFILKPNEKLVVADGVIPNTGKEATRPEVPMVSISHLTYEKKDSMVVETAWVYNKLLFDDETFETIARKMERWYGVNIEFKDSSIEKLRFSGAFESEPLAVALEALHISDSKSFNYSIKGKNIVITR